LVFLPSLLRNQAFSIGKLLRSNLAWRLQDIMHPVNGDRAVRRSRSACSDIDVARILQPGLARKRNFGAAFFLFSERP
jgi:hypothetical protein